MMQNESPRYKFNEDNLLRELKEYVDKTYESHYGQSKYQATETIIDSGWGRGFTQGNIEKYNKRVGKKGGPDEQRIDILKILHYGIILLYIHDTENNHESS